MNDFFNLDGPVFKYANMLADMFIISFLWIIFSIPLFTMGAASTAAYYVATRRISEREGYLIKDFWKAFRREFLKVTPVFLPIAIMIVIIFAVNLPWLNAAATYETMSPAMNSALTVLQYVLLVEGVMVLLYMFPVASRFDMNRKELFRTAFFMANRHMLITIIMLVFMVGGAFVLLHVFGLLILVFPGVFIYISSYLIMRIFRKYRPEIDAMPGDANYVASEDKAQEIEISGVEEEKSDDN